MVGDLGGSKCLFAEHGGEECFDLGGMTAFLQTGETILCPDIGIGNADRRQSRVRDKLEIGDDSNAQSAFDSFPDALAATDLKEWLDLDAGTLSRLFECPASG